MISAGDGDDVGKQVSRRRRSMHTVHGQSPTQQQQAPCKAKGHPLHNNCSDFATSSLINTHPARDTPRAPHQGQCQRGRREPPELSKWPANATQNCHWKLCLTYPSCKMDNPLLPMTGRTFYFILQVRKRVTWENSHKIF